MRSVASELRSEGFIKLSEGGVWTSMRTNSPRHAAQKESARRRVGLRHGKGPLLIVSGMKRLARPATAAEIAKECELDNKRTGQILYTLKVSGAVRKSDDNPAFWSLENGAQQAASQNIGTAGRSSPPEQDQAPEAHASDLVEPVFAVRSDGTLMVWAGEADGQHPDFTLHADAARELFRFMHSIGVRAS